MHDNEAPDDQDTGNAPELSHAIRVGRRLAQIREELGREDAVEWSQKAVAKRTCLTQNIIWRIESGGNGKIESWLRLMSLYEQKGYNLTWILAENNALISKFQIEEATTPGQLIEELERQLTEFQDQVNGKIELVRQLLQRTPRN